MTANPHAAWRQNPNLVECYENCVAMFAGLATAEIKPLSWDVLRLRREALGLNQAELCVAAGFPRRASIVSELEQGMMRASESLARVEAALDRLEADKEPRA